MPKSVRFTSVIALLLAASTAALMRAQSPVTNPQEPLAVQLADDQAIGTVDETPSLWFVELNSAPTADGTPLSQVRKEKDDFRAAASRAGVSFTERYAFDTLWNGISLRIDRSSIGALSRIPGVKAIYPVTTVTHSQEPNQGDASPSLYTAITMTGADIVQNTLGYTGAGVRVAVMDTGIDYNHPDLGGCFGPGCRVEKGYDFVGDAYDSSAFPPTPPVPDLDPDDCNGHGTHVSGIIGANGIVKGVAPGVTFYAYRVFGCDGTTATDIMIAAMERALADGADVLNMSIGSSREWPQTPSAAAATRLVNKGVSVVAAAGNDGSIGLYGLGAPSVGSKVISVAAFDNIANRLLYFTVTPDDRHIGYDAAAGAPSPPTSGSSPMARTGTKTSTADACAALPAGSLTGMVALIRRGTCSFNSKAFNAQNAGAIGVVIYNNVAGRVSPTVVGPPTITIPVVAVSDTEGVLINDRLATGPVTMTWTNQLDSFPSVTGGLISSFSSYGLSPDLDLKPDIGAPGGSVFSTLPLEEGGYGNLSGTSMASPHVAGAVALLLQAKPHTPSNGVRSILQNSAVPAPWWGNPGLGLLDNVHRQGAGMLRIDRAILATTSVDPGKLALGESQAGPATRTLTIHNDGPTDVTYTLSHTPALSTGPNTFTPAFLTGFATATFSVPSVLVPAGSSTTVDATITANAALANKSMYGGYLVISGSNGETVRVPYAGFKGDYQSIQVLVPTPNRIPMAHEAGRHQSRQPAIGRVVYDGRRRHPDHRRAFRSPVPPRHDGSEGCDQRKELAPRARHLIRHPEHVLDWLLRASMGWHHGWRAQNIHGAKRSVQDCPDGVESAWR